MAQARMTHDRWRQIAYWPLMISSFVWIIAYSWHVISDAHGMAAIVLRSLMALTWVVFAVDYIVRLVVADHRGVWFRRHLFDLAVVALPMLRSLRLLRMLTVLTTLQRTVGTALRSRLAIYGAGAALIVIYVGALAALDAERNAPGANITTFGDSIWWSFVTITTVGYGDYYPITFLGRLVAVGLMAGGVAIVGVVTATLSSWVIEVAARGHDEDEPATRGQVRALSSQLADVSARLGGTATKGNGTKENGT